MNNNQNSVFIVSYRSDTKEHIQNENSCWICF